MARSTLNPFAGRAPRLPARQQLAAFGHALADPRAIGSSALGYSCQDKGEWEVWCCAKGGADREYGGNLNVCLRNFTGGGLIPFAPWTIAGKGARWAGAGIQLPSPSEYDPENLIVVAYTDPLRLAFLGAVGALVSGGFGGGYVAQFVPPSILGWNLAIPLATARGGPARVWDNILEPIFQDQMDKLWALFQHGIGPAAAIAYFVKKEAAKPHHPPFVRAVLNVIGDNPNLLDALRDTKRIKEESTISSLGAAVKAAAPSQGDVVYGLGDAVQRFAGPISAVMQKPNADGALEALDRMGEIVIGVRPSLIKKNGVAAYKGLTAAGTAEGDARFAALNKVGAALEGLVGAFQAIQWPEVLKFISDAANAVFQFLAAVIAEIASLYAQLAGGGSTSPTIDTGTSTPSTSNKPPASTISNPKVALYVAPPLESSHKRVFAALGIAAAVAGGYALYRYRRRR